MCSIFAFLYLCRLTSAGDLSSQSQVQPHIVPLRREAVPVQRKGQVVSSKTSYSGIIHVGSPPQEFRVVFDTGSAHVVLPAATCRSKSCLQHRRYNASWSSTSTLVNADGSVVQDDELCDQVTIGFGTGEITGEFAKEVVCLGGQAPQSNRSTDGAKHLCSGMHVVQAVEMTDQPFRAFEFDGIMGLGLAQLALAHEFSFFEHLSASQALPAAQFAFYLTDGEQGEQSELAIGGHNPERVQEALKWSPIARPELGYWQVEILAVRVGGQELPICQDGGCRGIVDTGASHLGVPTSSEQEFAQLLTVASSDGQADCREADAPLLEIQLAGQTLTLGPEHYMRPLPLDKSVTVSGAGVQLPSSEQQVTKPTLRPASSVADGVRQCRPRTMPVSLPAPLGPKLFILGEPVLHRYYTAFDWKAKQVGFALANTRRNARIAGQQAERLGHPPAETVEYLLLQQSTQHLPKK